jgi:hypothetical protein
MKRNILSGVGSLALVYLAGPMLLLAYGIKRWAAASTSDWRDGWASVRAFSTIFGLCYLISLVFLLLLLPPFTAQEHLLKPFWQHLSLVVVSSVFPPDIDHIVIRWLFTLPLAPWCALQMERQYPRSGPQHYIRVELPGEIPEPEPAEKASKQTRLLTPTPPPAAEKPKRRRTTTENTTPKKKKAVAKPTGVLQEQTQGSGVASPSSETIRRSLWDQTDWSKVPDDDPTKQLALAEARRLQSMQIHSAQPALGEAVTKIPKDPKIPDSVTSVTEEKPAEKPKKRIDYSQVDE